jgi:hypothetical protein
MVSSLIGGPGWLPGGEGDGVAGPTYGNRLTFPFLFATIHFLFAFPALAHEREACEVVRCGGEKMWTCDTFLVLLGHDFIDVVCFLCV